MHSDAHLLSYAKARVREMPLAPLQRVLWWCIAAQCYYWLRLYRDRGCKGPIGFRISWCGQVRVHLAPDGLFGEKAYTPPVLQNEFIRSRIIVKADSVFDAALEELGFATPPCAARDSSRPAAAQNAAHMTRGASVSSEAAAPVIIPFCGGIRGIASGHERARSIPDKLRRHFIRAPAAAIRAA
jgi:hypothetical protein